MLWKGKVIQMDKREIGHEIHAVSNLLGRKIESEKRQLGIGEVTPIQIWIIRYLYENSEKVVFQKDIEKNFTITRSTVTGILKGMEKNGLIFRMSVPEDARLKRLTLTEKGENLCQSVCRHIEETEAQLAKGLSREEIDVFFELLDKIKGNLI